MKIIKEEIQLNNFESKIFNEYFGDMKITTFDIESMGLNPKYSELILACFMEVKDNIGYLTQFFVDSIEEEPLLCYEVIKKLNEYDVCLTYNGLSFDIPFVNERAKMLGLKQLGFDEYFVNCFDLDLFPTVLRNSKLKDIIPNFKQKTLEKYLQISDEREDEISGAESIELFKKYIFEDNITRKEEYGKKILLHNHDDVIQLYKLLDILKQVDFHRSRYKLGFPIKGINGWNNLYIEKIDIKNRTLIIKGKHNENDFSYISFEPNINFNYDGTFLIELPLQKIQNTLVINLNEMPLHKSNLSLLGGYINGYLIVKDEEINYKECNILSKDIILNIMEKLPR